MPDSTWQVLRVFKARRGGEPLAAVLAILLTLCLSVSALAAVGHFGGYSHDGVHIRAWSTVSSTSHGLGYRGHVACLTFYQEGDLVNGNPWWVYHRNFSTGVEGYSHSEYLYFDLPFTQCNW